MKQKQAADWREARRLRAWELKQKGWRASRIAEALGVTRGAVSQWFKKAESDGPEALYRRKHPGPTPRLRPAQLAQLPTLLSRGPEAYGWRGAVWTCKRVGVVIAKEFGVTYTPQQVGNLLRKLGWSRQKPQTRASQRDEAAIARWREEQWPALKKKRLKKDEL